MRLYTILLNSGGEVENRIFDLTPDWLGFMVCFCVDPPLHCVVWLRNREGLICLRKICWCIGYSSLRRQSWRGV
jgi:hypothetical protein